jgi:transcriptional regulator
MSTSRRFAARTPDDLARLVRDYPFAWVVSADDALHGARQHATALPLRAHCDEEGRIARVVGHFARSNPHVEALSRQPSALMLFLGPHGYVSPSWMSDRTQAPTWNYASVQCRATIVFHEDAARLHAAVEDLVDTHEHGRARRWQVADMGPRYHALARGIIGFEAEVFEVDGRFKLGQDERPDVLVDIVEGLAAAEGGGNAPLLEWMAQFNADRWPRR